MQMPILRTARLPASQNWDLNGFNVNASLVLVDVYGCSRCQPKDLQLYLRIQNRYKRDINHHEEHKEHKGGYVGFLLLLRVLHDLCGFKNRAKV